MTNREECQAALGTLRAILEKRAMPGTLAPHHRLLEEEAAELGRAIQPLADERDRMAEELKMAQAQGRATSAISS